MSEVTIPEWMAGPVARLCRDQAESLVREAAALQVLPIAAVLGLDPAADLRDAEVERADRANQMEDLYEAWVDAQDLGDKLLGHSVRYRSVPDEARRVHWRVDVDEAARAARSELLGRRAREAEQAEWRAAAAEMSWQDMAEELWGSEYQTPLAETAGCSRKTVQRADKPGGTLPHGIANWLASVIERVPPHLRRAYGSAFRAGRSSERAADGVLMAASDLEGGDLP